jgi:hypothetical protein
MNKFFMKLFCLFSILFLSSIGLKSQSDHLEPLKNKVEEQKWINSRYNSIKENLLKNDTSSKFLFRYLVFPSFEKGYAITIKKIDNKFILFYFNWPDSKWNEIDEELAISIYKLYCKAIGFTKPPAEGYTGGLDGTEYYFTITDSDDNTITGHKWSPDDDTKIYELVKISDLLSSLFSEYTYKDYRDEILEKCADLMKRFDKHE